MYRSSAERFLSLKQGSHKCPDQHYLYGCLLRSTATGALGDAKNQAIRSAEQTPEAQQLLSVRSRASSQSSLSHVELLRRYKTEHADDRPFPPSTIRHLGTPAAWKLEGSLVRSAGNLATKLATNRGVRMPYSVLTAVEESGQQRGQCLAVVARPRRC